MGKTGGYAIPENVRPEWRRRGKAAGGCGQEWGGQLGKDQVDAVLLTIFPSALLRWSEVRRRLWGSDDGDQLHWYVAVDGQGTEGAGRYVHSDFFHHRRRVCLVISFVFFVYCGLLIIRRSLRTLKSCVASHGQPPLKSARVWRGQRVTVIVRVEAWRRPTLLVCLSTTSSEATKHFTELLREIVIWNSILLRFLRYSQWDGTFLYIAVL